MRNEKLCVPTSQMTGEDCAELSIMVIYPGKKEAIYRGISPRFKYWLPRAGMGGGLERLCVRGINHALVR